MTDTTVWKNTPAKEFDWEYEAFYTVEASEDIRNFVYVESATRYRSEKWFILPIPSEVVHELAHSPHTRREWAIRSAEWYAEKYPHVPIRVVRHTFETGDE